MENPSSHFQQARWLLLKAMEEQDHPKSCGGTTQQRPRDPCLALQWVRKAGLPPSGSGRQSIEPNTGNLEPYNLMKLVVLGFEPTWNLLPLPLSFQIYPFWNVIVHPLSHHCILEEYTWSHRFKVKDQFAYRWSYLKFHLYMIQFNSVARSCTTLCDYMNRSTPGLPVHHQLPESTQTHVHWVGDAIQPSHPLLSPSPPSLNPSQHQGLFKWVNSSHQVAKVFEFQFQHQSF